jgi:acetyl-CoA carboxylase biotin carboxyl carrier protein
MSEVRADIAANVWQVLVENDQYVEAGEELLILESMKMEIPVEAPSAGVVTGLTVAPGDTVKGGDLLVRIEVREP